MVRQAFIIGALCLLPMIAHAEQSTPSQVAIQIDNVINQWAQTLENDQRIIADLQKQIADLKAKSEPKKDDGK